MTAARLDESERMARLRLFRSKTIGSITFHRLLSRFGSAQKALSVLPTMNSKYGGSTSIPIASVDEAMRELDQLDSVGGYMVICGDPEYPEFLLHIDDAPPVLSVIGRVELLNAPTFAIVGARNASANACRLTEKLSRELGAKNWIIASGLARGIDTAAHRSALPTGTVAVVAGGIDQIYPAENTNLYHEICKQGCVVSEMPFGTASSAPHFPRRNRIVSGMSRGVLVVETGLKSGSLITARLAAEQGRDVFAIPGFPCDPRAMGPNSLIQNGAKLVTCVDDITQELAFANTRKIKYQIELPIDECAPDIVIEPDEDLSNIHASIIENLSHTPLDIDVLVRSCASSIQVIQSALLDMELAGQIQRHPGNRVSRVA